MIIKNLAKQLILLKKDLSFYKSEFCLKNISILDIIKYAFISRDFRLNLLVRILLCKIRLISTVSQKLIFYLYGSSINRNANLNCKIRFCHSRNLVIGRHVIIEGGFAYFFNNISLGKLYPGSKSIRGSMPYFEGNCIFGTGSVILGSVKAGKNIVFGANSFCSLKKIPDNSTVVGSNKLKDGVFFFSNYQFPDAF
ncbi:hypothetical protein OAZ97_01485 [Prochlorococcus sp. AH-736-E15]|nr:hypothetical protein [Prochlorococcus sp. AH-736-E15]